MARSARSIGMTLLALYLILTGLFRLLPAFSFPAASVVISLLAIFAGIFLLMGR
ncbi:MAG TPA: hypothetical protein VMW27_23085 [Thermoanaerobaculia bacterium]|nr:hypothetical protein [Thermoanaerobaculia bacterium]